MCRLEMLVLFAWELLSPYIRKVGQLVLGILFVVESSESSLRWLIARFGNEISLQWLTLAVLAVVCKYTLTRCHDEAS